MRKIKAGELEATRFRLLAKQGHRCAICDVSFTDKKIENGKIKPKYTAVVDHCHTHGHVRGVICNNCNGGEGKIRTQALRCKRDGTPIQFLEQLLAYLKEHEFPKEDSVMHHTHKTDDDKRIRRNMLARKRRAEKKAIEAVRKSNE